jgi:hypothetical protein
MELRMIVAKRAATRCTPAGFRNHKELFPETANEALP